MFPRHYSLTSKKRKARFFFIAVVVGILMIISFCLGIFVSQQQFFASILNPANFSSISIEQNWPNIFQDSLVRQVWQIIQQTYLRRDKIDIKKMYYGALSGFVAGLEDPYSIFLDPDLTEEFEISIQGTFEGIGAEIGIKDGRLTIIAPLAGSPAEAAGLKSGDKVYAIDGIDTTGMVLTRAVKLIRGPKGTTVKLLILRDKQEPMEIAIVRDKIVIQSVESKMLKNNILYLSIRSFNGDTEELFDKILKSTNLSALKGIILDLRNNPGGRLDVAVNITGKWLDHQVAVREKFSDQKIVDYQTKQKAILANIPTVVLVNQGTASGAEILAGALQDYQLATIIGEETFGKGSVQSFIKLPGGASLKLTVAEWLTPKNRVINEQGIVPDIIVKMTEQDYQQNKDPQLEKAKAFLQNK